MGNLQISRKELVKLEEAQEQLRRLEAAGVDNWEGYSIALEGYVPKSKLYEQAEDLLQTIGEHTTVDYPAGHEAGPNVVFDDFVLETIVNLLEDKK